MSESGSPMLKIKDVPGSIGTSRHSSYVSLDDTSRGSITGISLEYDDYPLDLISPLVVNPYAESNSDINVVTESDYHLDTAAIFKNVWKPPSPPPMRDKQVDRTIGDEMITDYGRRSWCNYPENSDINGDIFVNYRTSLCLSQSQSNYTDKDTVVPRDTSDETHFIESSQHLNSNNICCRCRQTCFKICKPCLLNYHPLPDKPDKLDKMKHAFMCPPHGCISRTLSLSITVLIVWGISWGLLGQNTLPGGQVFNLFIISVLSYIAGRFMQLVRMPPLLGMLLTGVVLLNVPGIDIARNIDKKWSAFIRSIGLVLYLLNTSLSVDLRSHKKLSAPSIRLALIPFLLEAFCLAISVHYILDLPWVWAFLFSILTSCCGGSIIKPYLTKLNANGYGREEGVHTIITSAAIIEEKLVIFGFSLLLAIVFIQGNVIATIIQGPLEALGGMLYGLLTGVLCWYLPDKKHNDKWLLRVMLLVCFGLFAVLGSKALTFPGAGILGCVATPLVANYRWRRNSYAGDMHPAEYSINKMWCIIEPIFISLVGTEVHLLDFKTKQIGLAACVVLIGCIVRQVAAFSTVLRFGYSVKEKLFFPIAWTSKGHLQAVLCCVALDVASSRQIDPSLCMYSQQVIVFSILAVFISVPTSTLLLSKVGPLLLTKSKLHLDECRVNINLESPEIQEDRPEVTAEFETVT